MPLIEGVHQTHSHHLAKHTVEIVWHLRREKGAVLTRERPAGLEKVRHVKGPSRAIPVRRSHGVVSDRIQDVRAPFAVLDSLR